MSRVFSLSAHLRGSGECDSPRASENSAARYHDAERHPRTLAGYLGAVASTAAQREGLGTAVLGPKLATADGESIHAFLETSSEQNLDFYARLGFDGVDEIRIEGGPTVWAMLRPPAGG